MYWKPGKYFPARGPVRLGVPRAPVQVKTALGYVHPTGAPSNLRPRKGMRTLLVGQLLLLLLLLGLCSNWRRCDVAAAAVNVLPPDQQSSSRRLYLYTCWLASCLLCRLTCSGCIVADIRWTRVSSYWCFTSYWEVGVNWHYVQRKIFAFRCSVVMTP